MKKEDIGKKKWEKYIYHSEIDAFNEFALKFGFSYGALCIFAWLLVIIFK